MSGRDFALGLVVGVGGVLVPEPMEFSAPESPSWRSLPRSSLDRRLLDLPVPSDWLLPDSPFSRQVAHRIPPQGGPGGGWGPTGLAFAFMGSSDGACLGVLLAVS